MQAMPAFKFCAVIFIPIIVGVILIRYFGNEDVYNACHKQLNHVKNFCATFLCHQVPFAAKLVFNCKFQNPKKRKQDGENKEGPEPETNNIAGSSKVSEESESVTPYSDLATYELCMVKTPHDDQLKAQGLKEQGFNNFVSERIGLFREIPDARNSECKKKKYRSNLPTVSIVMCFYNEGWATLLRSINSILRRSPPDLLQEIVLLDDASSFNHLKDPLDYYIKEHFTNVKLIRSEKRLGLIRARMAAAKESTGEVLVFLDSHIEVGYGWLEPLLDRILQYRRTVVVPIVDNVEPETMIYRPAELVRGGFTWSLLHNWVDLPPDVKKVVEREAEPFISPTMPGGLFAMQRKYFYELGEYDAGMDIWGGENVEISFRIWLCGGRLEIIPCSRVAHVFRQFRPYKDPGGQDTALRNTARVAEVWLDDYKKHFYDTVPRAKDMDIGDVSDRVELRKRLKCRTFKWFLETIHPEQIVPGEKPKVESAYMRLKEWKKEVLVVRGRLKNIRSGWCVKGRSDKETNGDSLIHTNCNLLDAPNGMFDLTEDYQLKLSKTRFCLETSAIRKKDSDATAKVFLGKCHASGGAQVWIHQQYEDSDVLFNPASGKCLASAKSGKNELIIMDFCHKTRSKGFMVTTH